MAESEKMTKRKRQKSNNFNSPQYVDFAISTLRIGGLMKDILHEFNGHCLVRFPDRKK